VSASYWRHVALTWHLTESVKNFKRNLTPGIDL